VLLLRLANDDDELNDDDVDDVVAVTSVMRNKQSDTGALRVSASVEQR